MRDDYPAIATRAEALVYACEGGGPAAVAAAREALHEAWQTGFVEGFKRPARESWLEWMVRLAKVRGV